MRAVKTWIGAGGRRLDSADSYFNDAAVGAAWKDSGVAREDLFILSKVGPTNPLGFQTTLDQMAGIKEHLGTSYVDMLLVHWPTYKPNALNFTEPKDPYCNTTAPTYNAKQCRLSTWKAMIELLDNGSARAIGVSNYNSSHIEEIMAAYPDNKTRWPAVNQCPFHPYRSSSQMATVKFCQANDIVFLGYSPLGIPDWHKYPAPLLSTSLQEPKIHAIAQAHGATPAQIILAYAWSQGIPTNPRSMNEAHMKENMAVFDIKLNATEVATMGSFPQCTCKIDPTFYECAP